MGELLTRNEHPETPRVGTLGMDTCPHLRFDMVDLPRPSESGVDGTVVKDSVGSMSGVETPGPRTLNPYC